MQVLIVALVSAFLTATVTTAGAAENAQPSLPPCPAATATLDGAIDSAKANVGDVFRFTTAGAIGSAVPGATGARGFGVVSFVEHASRARGGELLLEARYIVNADGSKTPATVIASNSLYRGSDRDLPFVFALTGLFHSAITSAISAAAGLYGFAHRGSEASLPAGSTFKVVLGDGLIEGSCSPAALVDGPRNYRAPR